MLLATYSEVDKLPGGQRSKREEVHSIGSLLGDPRDGEVWYHLHMKELICPLNEFHGGSRGYSP